MESFFAFIFSFFISSQLGKHFFFPFSFLSGIRIDYLAPTLYLTDILSLFFVLIVIRDTLLSLRTKHAIVKQSQKGRLPRSIYTLSSARNDMQKYIYLFLLILLIFINYSFSLSKPLWFYSAFKIVQWAAIFYYFKIHAKNKSIFSATILGLLAGSVLQLILALFQLASRHSIQGWWYYLGERSFSIFTPGIAKAYFLGREFLRSYGTFSHPNSLAGFYLLIYVFSLTQKRITNQLLKTLLLVLSSALVLISFSRTAIVIYVLINLIYFFKRAFTCRICFFAKIVTALFLILFAFHIGGDANTLLKRDDFTQKSLSIIAKQPFTGVGIGSYLIAQHEYPQKFSTFFEQPVHNIFLLAIAQLGIPLSILLAIIIYKIIKVKVKNISYFLPLLVIILTGCMDHYWLTLQQNVLLTAVVFGMMNSYETKTPRTG